MNANASTAEHALRIERIDQERWRRTAPSFRDYNYRQLWAFGEACAQRVGAVSEHVAVLRGDEIIGLADVRIKRIPLLRTGIAYVTGGPLVRTGDGHDVERLQVTLRSLVAEYVGGRSLVLRIAPALGPGEWNEQQNAVFRSSGFQDSRRPQSYRTLVVDIGRPLDETRKSLDRKWRNHLNRSEKNGLTVESGSSRECFEQFCRLYDEMTRRKGFVADLDAGFHARIQSMLNEREQFLVTLTSHDGVTVAGHVNSMLGDTCVSLLAATGEAGLHTKAAYLTQWHVIDEAHRRGCLYYDLGGIDPNENPGVYEFKKGLGGIDVTVAGPLEFRPNWLARHAVSGCEFLYRLFRRRNR